jgi:hypothetical protein
MKALRADLAIPVVAAVLPLLLLAGAVTRAQLAEEREMIDGSMKAVASALTLAVDGEIKASKAVIETLAASPALDTGDIKGFHELCVRAMAGRKGAYIVLFDASGKQLVNSQRPFGSALPNPLAANYPFDPRYRDVPMGGAANVKRVLETGQPWVSNLFIGLVSHEPRIGLDIPVVRDGRVRYILEMALDPAELSRMLAEQRSPDSSVVAIVDRKGIALASSISSRTNVGKPLAPDLAEQVENAASGAGIGRDSEGREVYHVFTESPVTGWKTSLSVIRSSAHASVADSSALAVGAVFAILVALVAAFALGSRVVGRTEQGRS